MLEAFQTYTCGCLISSKLLLKRHRLDFTDRSEEKCKEFNIVQLLEATGKTG